MSGDIEIIGCLADVDVLVTVEVVNERADGVTECHLGFLGLSEEIKPVETSDQQPE